MPRCIYSLIILSIGEVGVVWMDGETPLPVRILLPGGKQPVGPLIQRLYPDSSFRREGNIAGILSYLKAFDGGSTERFPLEDLALHRWGEFRTRVWAAAWSIPRGEVRSYGQIAQSISNPRAMRAVGGALGRNPFPLLIPCHRVIRSTGELGGFTSGGPISKERLLRREGARFDQRGRVPLTVGDVV